MARIPVDVVFREQGISRAEQGVRDLKRQFRETREEIDRAQTRARGLTRTNRALGQSLGRSLTGAAGLALLTREYIMAGQAAAQARETIDGVARSGDQSDAIFRSLAEVSQRTGRELRDVSREFQRVVRESDNYGRSAQELIDITERQLQVNTQSQQSLDSLRTSFALLVDAFERSSAFDTVATRIEDTALGLADALNSDQLSELLVGAGLTLILGLGRGIEAGLEQIDLNTLFDAQFGGLARFLPDLFPEGGPTAADLVFGQSLDDLERDITRRSNLFAQGVENARQERRRLLEGSTVAQDAPRQRRRGLTDEERQAQREERERERFRRQQSRERLRDFQALQEADRELAFARAENARDTVAALNPLVDLEQQVREDAEALALGFAQGTLSADEFTGSLERLGDEAADIRLDIAARQIRDQFGPLLGVASRAAAGFTDTLIDSATRGGDAWLGFAEQITRAVARIAAQIVIAQALNAITPGLGTAVTGIGGALGGSRQFGGPTPGGQEFLVGENGPERVRLPRRGVIDTAAETRGATREASSAAPLDIRLETIDGGTVLRAMASVEGEQVFMKFVERSAGRVRRILAT